ncbi:MAG: hypothetical protein VX874_09420 [Pseudomonadota bacterium]|nr:hypothetical protein [Pseudomonadota bacterium]
MADQTMDGLRACIASLEMVVAPAVTASGDKLAQEQVKLIGKYLSFLVDRLDYTDPVARAELSTYLEIGRTVQASLAREGRGDPKLDESLADGKAVLERANASQADVEHPLRAVKADLSRIVRAMGETSDPMRKEVEKIVRDGSFKVVRLQRVWMEPQGWEQPGITFDIDEELKAFSS